MLVCGSVLVCVFLCFSTELRQNFGPAFCGILEFWKFLKGLIHYAIRGHPYITSRRGRELGVDQNRDEV